MQLVRGDFRAAHASALAALADDREVAAPWTVMAAIALEGGNAARARDLADRALALGGPDEVMLRARLLLGRALLRLADRPALMAVARAIADRPPPTDPLLADTAGALLVHAGLVAAALPFAEASHAAAPDNAAFAYNCATTRQFVGDLAGAAAAYRAALAADPDRHDARLALTQLEPASDALLRDVAARFAAAEGDMAARLALGHAAARIAEELGRDAEALDWLDGATALAARARPYEPAAAAALCAAAADWPDAATDSARRPTPASPAPLFVAGLPRSGTTLTDRLLAAHPQIVSAGELGLFADAFKRAAGTPGAHVLDAATLAARPDPAAVAAAYRAGLAACQPVPPAVRYVIDKMPFNAFFAGHILAALPDARLLIVRRDPVDLVFASYRQMFAVREGYYDYNLDIDATTDFVARFARLADGFAARAHPRVAMVGYEALVADPDREVARLLRWLGLARLDGPADPRRAATPVTTASSVQVREAVHARSVARWRRYGARGQAVADRIAALLA